MRRGLQHHGQGHLLRGHALSRSSRSSTRGKERRDVVLTMRANNRLAGFHRRPACPKSARRQLGSSGVSVRSSTAMGVDDRQGRRRATPSPTPTDDSREEIAGWPDGTYEADVYVDSDPQGNQDMHVHVAVTVDDDRLIIDFDGSDERPDICRLVYLRQYPGQRHRPAGQHGRPLASPRTRDSSTASSCVCPLGCCLNPVEGKPVSSGHAPSRCRSWRRHRASPCPRSFPSAAHPQTYKFGSPRQMCGDVDPRTGRPFFDHGGEVSAGLGQRRSSGVDGWGAHGRRHGQPDQGRGGVQ